MNFQRIKDNYDHQLWTVDMVRTAVRKGIITPEQFEQITKMPYNE